MRLTKKQKEFVKEIYRDEDGVWCILNPGFGWGVDETSVIHCETYAELKEEMKDVHSV